MDLLRYPLAFIATLGVLITIHEFGHYLMARWSGVRILRFSVGFGRPLLSWTDQRGTEFALAAIPFGGYLRMYDHRDPAVEHDGRPGDVSFSALSPWWRIVIAVGGPAANFVLAFVVYWVVFLAGTSSYAPVLGEPPEGSPLADLNMPVAQEIVAVDGVETGNWQQVSLALADRLGESGRIRLTTLEPGSARTRDWEIPIQSWHRGVGEPDLFASLGIVPTVAPVFGRIVEESPAQAAGLAPQDRVVSVNGERVDTWQQWVDVVRAAPASQLALTVNRNGQQRVFYLSPQSKVDEVTGEVYGFAGVGPLLKETRYGPVAAVGEALRETASKTAMTLGMLKKMVVGDVSLQNLSGPITIAHVAGESSRSGWRSFVDLMALLSISLGVLNLLPIPVLDGGHIIYALAEAIRGEPVSERWQIMGTQIGILIVGGLMILAVFNDVARLF